MGRPARAHYPKTPHFYRQGLGQPGTPQALTFIDRASAGPAPQFPHFYQWALGRPGPPKSLTFIDGARPPKPLTSIDQTPHFYQTASRRKPSVTPAGVTPRATGTANPYFPGLAPSLFGKPSSGAQKMCNSRSFLDLEDEP